MAAEKKEEKEGRREQRVPNSRSDLKYSVDHKGKVLLVRNPAIDAM